MKVLVKRSIEESPEVSDKYITNLGKIDYQKEDDCWVDSIGIDVNPAYWYEEIELSKLLEDVMPTKDMICDDLFEKMNDFLMNEGEYPMPTGFRRTYGYPLAKIVINWLKSKLTT